MGTQLQVAKVGNVKSARDLLDSMAAQFAMVLPKHITPERLIRTAITACQRQPKLLECTQQSLVGALMAASEMGLEPNGVLGQGHLIARWNGKTKRFEAQFQPGYKGLRDLAYRSGKVKMIQAHIVYENDKFEYSLGLHPSLNHVPATGDRGNMRGCYAVAHVDGVEPIFEYRTREEIEAHRDRFTQSRNKNGSVVGPWVDHFEGMALKTLVIMIFKWLPCSTEMERAVYADMLADGMSDEDVIDISATAPPSDIDELTARLESRNDAEQNDGEGEQTSGQDEGPVGEQPGDKKKTRKANPTTEPDNQGSGDQESAPAEDGLLV